MRRGAGTPALFMAMVLALVSAHRGAIANDADGVFRLANVAWPNYCLGTDGRNIRLTRCDLAPQWTVSRDGQWSISAAGRPTCLTAQITAGVPDLHSHLRILACSGAVMQRFSVGDGRLRGADGRRATAAGPDLPVRYGGKASLVGTDMWRRLHGP